MQFHWQWNNAYYITGKIFTHNDMIINMPLLGKKIWYIALSYISKTSKSRHFYIFCSQWNNKYKLQNLYTETNFIDLVTTAIQTCTNVWDFLFWNYVHKKGLFLILTKKKKEKKEINYNSDIWRITWSRISIDWILVLLLFIYYSTFLPQGDGSPQPRQR